MVSELLCRTKALLFICLVHLCTLAAPASAAPKATSDGGELARLRARLASLSPTPAVPSGSLRSIQYLLDTSKRISKSFPAASKSWRARAGRYLKALEAGKDPYATAHGEIVNRGYRSPVSTRTQGYAVYIPPNYDPAKKYPVMVILHGGSSNGNLFLGVVLGNNMNWKEYDQHLWDDYTPRWSPDWIVVAVDGFGQILWRFMAERDVFDVLADVIRHYSVDEKRLVLSGLSNGGLGAYSLAARHGDRFSLVQAIAGSPSWLKYAGERTVVAPERVLLESSSAISLLPNLAATDFRYYHGHTDPGPMRPAYVKALDAALAEQKVKATGVWYDAGHDLLYRVQRHGRVFEKLGKATHQPSPTRVHLRTGDLRAGRQHWLRVTRRPDSNTLSEIKVVVENNRVQIRAARNVGAFSLDLRTLPIKGDKLVIEMGGKTLLEAPRTELGSRVHLVQKGQSFAQGFADLKGLHKRPGLSGPVTDAYFGRMVHVYGTANAEHQEALEKAARKGAQGWPVWLWGVEQEVIPDSQVTPALAAKATLVLYGTPGDNRVLERLWKALPIRVEGDAVRLGRQSIRRPDVGVRYVYPNPEAPSRYIIVQAGVTTRAVALGHNLPDFVPDYVVYDAQSARRRPRLVPGRPAPAARGFFDARWQLPAAVAAGGE